MKKIIKTAAIAILFIFTSANILQAQEALRIDPAGNVGIGTAPNPNLKLQVNGSVSVGPLSATSINTNGINCSSINTNGSTITCGTLNATTLTGNLTSSIDNNWIRTGTLIATGSTTTPNLTVNGLITGDQNSSISIPLITTGQLNVEGGFGHFLFNIGPGAGTGTTPKQGLYLGWNQSGRKQEVNFINNMGNFSFGNSTWPPTVMISSAGYVGIGTGDSDPSVPLEVTRADDNHPFSGDQSSGSLYDGKGNEGIAFIQNYAISIKTNKFMLAAGYYASSDSRIKKGFKPAISNNDLAVINQLRVTDYQYKDIMASGNSYNKGFVAQDVEKILPSAVTKRVDFIPDVYALAEKSSVINKVLTISLKDAHHFITGDMVRIVTEKNVTKEVTVQVINENTFAINEWNEVAGKIFVYGKKVNDFRSVDYQQIFSLGISATQELSKQVDVLKGENTAMLQALTAVQSQLASLQKKVDAQTTTVATVNK